MTASIISGAGSVPITSGFGPFSGLRALIRKDATEWRRGVRAWVVLGVAMAFMVLGAANGWITHHLAANLPPGSVDPEHLGSLAPVDNFLAAVTSQIFVIATLFAAGAALPRERESGTLAWVASKPVTRASIWSSKFVTMTVALSLLAGIIPLAATAVVVTVLYGALPISLVVGAAIGIAAVVAFFAAVGLALGTTLPGQSATIAAAFAVFALLPVVAGVLPFDATPFLPTSMLAWPAAALSGASVSFVTPVAWIVVTGALAGLAIRGMGRLEL
jgi:ABC-type transport system involved in multi-copper enzyme maturation permease subunit